jgi:hypothetical protein
VRRRVSRRRRPGRPSTRNDDAQGTFLVRSMEQVAAIVAGRFEQSVSGDTRAWLAIHDRLGDEAIQDLEHLFSRNWVTRGDRERRVEVEAAGGTRRPSATAHAPARRAARSSNQAQLAMYGGVGRQLGGPRKRRWNRSSTRATICGTLIVRTQTAASSMASGMPSGGRHRSTIAEAFDSVLTKAGSTAVARSSKSAMAS